jgi:hypothetical protein
LREGASELTKTLTASLLAEVDIHGSYPLLTRRAGARRWLFTWKTRNARLSSSAAIGFRVLSQADSSR